MKDPTVRKQLSFFPALQYDPLVEMLNTSFIVESTVDARFTFDQRYICKSSTHIHCGYFPGSWVYPLVTNASNE